MAEEANWWSELETNIQKLTVEVSRIGTEFTKLQNLRADLDKFADQIRAEVNHQIDETVHVKVATMQPLPVSDTDCNPPTSATFHVSGEYACSFFLPKTAQIS